MVNANWLYLILYSIAFRTLSHSPLILNTYIYSRTRLSAHVGGRPDPAQGRLSDGNAFLEGNKTWTPGDRPPMQQVSSVCNHGNSKNQIFVQTSNCFNSHFRVTAWMWKLFNLLFYSITYL